ncbi:MAG TPA: hypothetical protein VGJ05_10390 [Fimbriiglobus sp.]
MPLQPGDVIVVCLLACALVGIPATVAYVIFGLFRREPPTVPADSHSFVDAESARVGAAPRHGRRRSSHSAAPPRRFSTPDFRNRFGRN